MNENEISEFELRKFFLEYYKKSIDLTTNHPDFKFGEDNNHLKSENCKEAGRIFDFMVKIDGLISDLNKTQIFIRRFPLKKYYEDNNIDQLDFIKYHYEVFIHKIHTILEVKKLWINDFYKIGLKEEDCNWNNLKDCKEIKNSPLAKIIEAYYKSFNHLIKFRHLNTHRAFFKDSEIEKLKRDLLIYNGYKKLGIDVGDDFKKIRPKFLVDYQIKEYRKEKLEYIGGAVNIAEIYSEQFITVVQTEFFNKILKEKTLRNKV